jgi:hypothetical protein
MVQKLKDYPVFLETLKTSIEDEQEIISFVFPEQEGEVLKLLITKLTIQTIKIVIDNLIPEPQYKKPNEKQIIKYLEDFRIIYSMINS